MNKYSYVAVLLSLLISIPSYGYSTLEVSEETPVDIPRGPEINREAGHCDVGPFGVDGDVGEYQGMCNSLTAGEKCFAYIKQNIGDLGKLKQADDRAKAIFCLKSILIKIAD